MTRQSSRRQSRYPSVAALIRDARQSVPWAAEITVSEDGPRHGRVLADGRTIGTFMYRRGGSVTCVWCIPAATGTARCRLCRAAQPIESEADVKRFTRTHGHSDCPVGFAQGSPVWIEVRWP